ADGITRSMRAINAPARSGRDAVATSSETALAFARSTGATMQQAGNVNVIVGMAAMVAALAAATPQASAADLLKPATAQRGAWESAPPELGQSAGIFAKHGIDLDVVYTRDGEVEPSVTSDGTDVGVGVGTIGVLRAYARGAPVLGPLASAAQYSCRRE